MEEDIPEWKRGAIVITDQTSQEKQGMIKRLRSKLGGKINKTEYA